MEGEGTMPTDDELFTPSEVLGGFPAKRARLLLFQIESRTAHLMLQSRRTVDLYLTEEIADSKTWRSLKPWQRAANCLSVRRSETWNAMPRNGNPWYLPTRPYKPPWHTCWHRNTALRSEIFPTSRAL